MITPARIAELLRPFGLSLDPLQVDRVRVYLDLLLKWNSKINLVGKAPAEECVTRHFGESLFLTRCLELGGRLLDIGSGAGFPGLAVKIVRPELEVTLLERVAKKRAFLKEVVRVCGFKGVQVLGDRLEDFSAKIQAPKYESATSRAVGGVESLTRYAAHCLKPGGFLCLWLGHQDAETISKSNSRFAWRPPVAIPLSRCREILIGDLVR